MWVCVSFAVNSLEIFSDMPCSHSRSSNLAHCHTLASVEVFIKQWDTADKLGGKKDGLMTKYSDLKEFIERTWHYSAKMVDDCVLFVWIYRWEHAETSVSLTARSSKGSVRVQSWKGGKKSGQEKCSCISKWNKRKGEMKEEVKHRCGAEGEQWWYD